MQGNFDFTNFDKLANCWNSYSGTFVNNLMHGQGTLVLANGEKFIGKFNKGKIHGDGIFHKSNGEILSGLWN